MAKAITILKNPVLSQMKRMKTLKEKKKKLKEEKKIMFCLRLNNFGESRRVAADDLQVPSKVICG